MLWILQEIPPGDYKQPYGTPDVPMREEKQETVEPQNEVGMQEETVWREKMREKGGYEENNPKMRVQALEQKHKNPDADGTRDLMQQMNVAWHRISGSPLLPACSDRKVSLAYTTVKKASHHNVCAHTSL